MIHNIIPAIIPASEKELRELIRQLNFASKIQLDVVDGMFVRNRSWPHDPPGSPSAVSDLLQSVNVIVDIMSYESVRVAREWLSAGAKGIVLHLEVISEKKEISSLKKDFDSFELYLSGNDTLAVSEYMRFADVIDGVQLMGIHEIGSQGQPQSELVIKNIRNLRSLAPRLPIMIDGSVNEGTIDDLLSAGANHFVVGSAMMNSSDKQKFYQGLFNRVNKKGSEQTDI